RFICPSKLTGPIGPTGLISPINSTHSNFQLCRRIFIVVQHRRLFAQQSGVSVKLPTVMPVFVVNKREMLPDGECSVRRFERTRQVLVGQRSQRFFSSLVTFARVFLAIGDGL